MMDPDHTIIIIGSLGELKVYEVREHPRKKMGADERKSYGVHLVTGLDFIDMHKKLSEVVTDQAGRFGHSIGEEHELQNERKKRTIKEIAKDIEAIVQKLEPKNLFLSFPKEYLHKLEAELPNHVKGKITKLVGADLIKVSAEKLLSHFLDD